ncbi:MAG: hypothetical protein ACI9LT_002246 [Pseudoalteromonas distincta]
MSDEFSFLFAFYGLLLGLAVTEIVAGFSRAYDERAARPLGVIAPLFAILLFLDLITFWVSAWEWRALNTVEFAHAVAAAVVALLYYFAATQVFPKEGDVDTLTNHILQHRRPVVFCVIVSNIIALIPTLISAIETRVALMELGGWMVVNLVYYGALILAATARSHRVIIATLVLVIAYVSGATLLLG